MYFHFCVCFFLFLSLFSVYLLLETFPHRDIEISYCKYCNYYFGYFNISVFYYLSENQVIYFLSHGNRLPFYFVVFCRNYAKVRLFLYSTKMTNYHIKLE
jgi:hypothetical protein